MDRTQTNGCFFLPHETRGEEMVQMVSPFMEGPPSPRRQEQDSGRGDQSLWLGKEGSECGGSTAVVSVGKRREGQEQMGPASTK